MLAVAFPADNIDWGGIHWNPSFLHTGGDHSEARRCFDCSGQKRQSLAALRRDYRCPKNDCNPSENRCDTDHSGYGTVRQENGKAACPVWRMLNFVEEASGYPLLLRNKGGPSGAGSVLTSRGQTLLDAYERFENAAKENVEKLYEAYLGDVI